MKDKIVEKVFLGLAAALFALTLADRRRRGIPIKGTEVGNLAAAGAPVLAVIPSAFGLPNIWAVPFFITAAGLLVFAVRRFRSPASSSPPSE